VSQNARQVLYGYRTAALRRVVGTATALCPSAALGILHELFNVPSLDPIARIICPVTARSTSFGSRAPFLRALNLPLGNDQLRNALV
jgi:hypothetical protein